MDNLVADAPTGGVDVGDAVERAGGGDTEAENNDDGVDEEGSARDERGAGDGGDFPDDFEDWTHLNEEVVEKMKRKDPSVVHLALSFDSRPANRRFDAGSIDWTSEGKSLFADNLLLKSLGFDYVLPLHESNFEDFIRSVGKNRSIKHLFVGADIDRGDIFTWLSPFFEHNPNLRSFEVGHVESFSGYDMDSDTMTALGNALVKNTTITKLVLFRDIGPTRDIEADAWVALSRGISSLSSSLVELNLGYSSIEGEGVNALARSLANMTKLKDLNLTAALFPDNTVRGWRTFFSNLKGCHSLRYLCLDENNLNDQAISPMANALASMRSLKTLSLHENLAVTAQGWQTFAGILQQPGCSLEDLSLVCYGEPVYVTDVRDSQNNVDDEVIVAIANGLIHNSTLKELQVGRNHPDISERGWTALSRVLCDRSSANSIHSSNHTLERVSWSGSDDYITTGEHIFWRPRIWDDEVGFQEENLTDDQRFLVSFLRLNESANKLEVARKKIILYHFSGGEKHIEEMAGLDLQLMPRAMAWMGRCGDGLSILYRVIQSAPSLFEMSGMAGAIGGKRKRGH